MCMSLLSEWIYTNLTSREENIRVEEKGPNVVEMKEIVDGCVKYT